MSSQASYYENSVTGAYYSSQTSSRPEGQSHEIMDDMLPPVFPDLPMPPPMEIDLLSSNSSISRTFSSPSMSLPMGWDINTSVNYPFEPQLGTQSVNQVSEDTEGTVLEDQQNPLVKWWSRNDGPWNAIKPIVNETVQPLNGGGMLSGDYRYNVPGPGVNTSFHCPAPSDSGYGTRQSVGNTSVFNGDFHDKELDSQSSLGPQPDPSYPGGDDHLDAFAQEVLSADAWTQPGANTVERNAPYTCPTCDEPVKTRSELKKHDLRHKRPFFCPVSGCGKREGFGTPNDLDRHIKSKHPSEAVAAGVKSNKRWRCLMSNCKSKDNSWPRRDNFRSHLVRVHKDTLTTPKEINEMVARGEFMDQTGVTRAVDDQGQHENSSELFAHCDPSNLVQFNEDEHNELHANRILKANSSGFLSSEEPSLRVEHGQGFSMIADLSNQTSQEHRKDYSKQTEFKVPSLPASRQRVQPPISIDPDLLLATDGVRSSDNDQGEKRVLQKSKSKGDLVHSVAKLSSISKSKGKQKASFGSGMLDQTLLRKTIMQTTANQTPRVSLEASSSSDAEAKKNELELVDQLKSLGYIVHKNEDTTPEASNTNQSSAVTRGENKVTCSVCKKFHGRPCEVKKHMLRHSKPYGCTINICDKTFGSKNDWKRHEISQHLHHETYHCGWEDENNVSCGIVYHRSQAFRLHLKADHQIRDDASLRNYMRACRVYEDCQSSFWCGFCVANINLEASGHKGWDERFDHIDSHFVGRGVPPKNIQEWVSDGASEDLETVTELTPVSKSGPSQGSMNPPSVNARARDVVLGETVAGHKTLKRKNTAADEERYDGLRAKRVNSTQLSPPQL